MDDIRDIKGPVPLPGRAAGGGWLAGLALAGLCGLAVWRWRRVRQNPRRVALVAARRELAGLDARAGTLDDRDYYFLLAAIVRRILAVRLAVAATAMTTVELGPVLSGLPPVDRAGASELLARADAACYAGLAVTAAVRRRDAQTARHLAVATRP